MKPLAVLKQQLERLDGSDYGAYQSLRGAWSYPANPAYPAFELHIDAIPKDPYAPPHTGVYRVRVGREASGFPDAMSETRMGEVALRDFLARRVFEQCGLLCGSAGKRGSRGTGHSGLITIAEPGQAILERSSLVVTPDFVEARIFLGLPSRKRAIAASTAATMLFEELPAIVASSLFLAQLDAEALERHLTAAADSAHLRGSLAARGLVAFVPDGALLARASGIDPRPLAAPGALPFASPESLRVRIDLPGGRTVQGLGIPAGVTLIVGGGYHGKSTLLRAIEAGIYDHVPGDGRENCVTLPEAVKVRAADGRSVTRVDISAYIGGIPNAAKSGGADSAATSADFSTADFSTSNASGSTSQAAFIAESIEAGARVLLLDEDTSATNFMIRDRRMQALVAKADEPITAFVDTVRRLHASLGISTVLVMGGSGDYFDVADHVIQMTGYRPHNVTAQAREIAVRHPTGRSAEGAAHALQPRPRAPLDEGLDPHNEHGHLRVTASEPQRLTYGDETVDLADLEQLAEAAQTRAIGRAILHARRHMDGQRTLAEVAALVMSELRAGGLDVLDPERRGNLAMFRAQDFAAALNRMRSLSVRQGE